MKVLYIAHSGSMQGSGFALLNIIKGMLFKGVEVLVMLPHEGAMTKALDTIHVPYFISSFYSTVYPPVHTLRDIVRFVPLLFRLFICNHMSAKRLERIIKAESPDIIHTNTGVIHFGYKVAKSLGIPHVWHIREFQNTADFGWYPIEGMGRLKKYLYSSANYNIAITKSVYNYYYLFSRNSKVIYDGVFSITDIVRPILVKKKYFLFVGDIVEGKGPHKAVDAFIRAVQHNSEYELWLAGNDISYFAIRLKKYVERHSWSNRIKFLGFRTDVMSLMQHATALLVCSENEGFGFITVEAMLCHCLVIGHNSTGTKEQFENGLNRCGEEIGIRYNTQQELEESIFDIIANGEKKYQLLVDRAYDTVSELYTTEQNVEKVYKYYGEILYR